MKWRTLYFLAFFASLTLLLAAYYVQYIEHIAPCPLCIMQRIAYYLIAITCLLGIVRAEIKPRIYASLIMLFSAIGLGFAIRHIYLQHLPDGMAPACAPSLKFMLENFPLHDLLKVLFYGSGDCSIVTWRLLGLSMAEWSLLGFILFFIGGTSALIYAFIPAKKINITHE